MRIKDDTVNIWGLDRCMQKALKICDQIYASNGNELVITSARDSMHSAGSLHYYGYAIDTRVNYFTETSRAKVFSELREQLNPLGYDVVDEGNHFHIEFDPK